MATSPDAATLAEYKETAKELLGDDVSVSVVGLHRYAQTWHDLLGLTGGYYQDGKGGVQYRTGMIKTPMPEESLRSWQVHSLLKNEEQKGVVLDSY